MGVGDTRLLFEVLDRGMADDLFEAVREEVAWNKMFHRYAHVASFLLWWLAHHTARRRPCHDRGGVVPRLVAIQGSVTANGTEPLYRHPADEQPLLVPFTPLVDKIRRRVEEVLGQPINHALIQWYKSGSDFISVRARPLEPPREQHTHCMCCRRSMRTSPWTLPRAPIFPTSALAHRASWCYDTSATRQLPSVAKPRCRAHALQRYRRLRAAHCC